MIKIYYKKLPTPIPGSFQKVLLLDKKGEKVGIASCPKREAFLKFSQEKGFEEVFQNEPPSLILNEEPSKELEEALELFSAEPGIVKVRCLLDALNS